MRSLPLPLALTARLTPVAVLACAGWALSSGPAAPSASAGHPTAQKTPAGSSAAAPSSSTAAKTYTAAPAPCSAVPAGTVKSLVPGAKTAGKEIPSTDTALRRTCSWNALQGYDYRWLDVSFEISESDQGAEKEYEQRVAEKSGGGVVPGLGDSAYSVVNLTTEDGQQTREGVVLVRAANALVVVTYNGSDFENKKAPGTDEINKGAIKAAKSAVAALGAGRD
ncbi:membrane protein [Streptomyces hygroscopicus subsp. limoneus]|nr:membrane protein [Streptomyces hygroscopicus subsp. limoneus]